MTPLHHKYGMAEDTEGAEVLKIFVRMKNSIEFHNGEEYDQGWC